MRAKTNRAAFTVVEVLVVLMIIAMLVALMAPTDRGSAREASRQGACQNNLKQIGLALFAYAEEHGRLPPAYTTDENGTRLHSWRTLILPYLEEGALFKRIDLTKPWDDPVNAEAAAARVSAYLCPSSRAESPRTKYLAVLTLNSFLRADNSRRLSEIPDSGSKAVMVVEVDADHAVPWMSPTDADEELFLSSTRSLKHDHPGLCYAVFADGHVQMLATDTTEELAAMIAAPRKSPVEAAAEK